MYFKMMARLQSYCSQSNCNLIRCTRRHFIINETLEGMFLNELMGTESTKYMALDLDSLFHSKVLVISIHESFELFSFE